MNEAFKNRVLDLFDVDLSAGTLRRKSSRGSQAAGTLAGTRRPDGYLQISVDNVCYLLHRVLWFLRTGDCPECIDHLDGNRDNNSFGNLRAANASINGRNQRLGRGNKSGVMGVRYRSDKHCFIAFWLDENGVRKQKNFPCAGRGLDAAKRQAVAYRDAMIVAVNERGGGYTPNHGATP